jgi:GGDEF domain-containing protein
LGALRTDISGTSRAVSDDPDKLRELAAALQSCLRATDTLARVGERSFSIILEDLSQPDQAARVKHQVEQALREVLVSDPAGAPLPLDVKLEFYDELDTPPPDRVFQS